MSADIKLVSTPSLISLCQATEKSCLTETRRTAHEEKQHWRLFSGLHVGVPMCTCTVHTYEHACKHAPTHMQNKTDSTKCWRGCRPSRTLRSRTVCVTLKSYKILYEAKHIHSLWFGNSFRCLFKRNTTHSQNICTRTYEYMWQYLILLIIVDNSPLLEKEHVNSWMFTHVMG